MQQPNELSRRRFLQAGAAAGAGALAVGGVPGQALADGEVPRRALAEGAPVRAGFLRVGARRDPLGVQDAHPLLSWQVTGPGHEQRAYQVRAATSTGRLRSGRADLWDTGRVASAGVQVRYGGRALSSRLPVHWQVRVWDERGRVSAWSPAAAFEMGLLAPRDWTAQWVGNPGWDAMGRPTPPATVAIPAQTARFVRLSVTKLGLPLKEGAWPDPVSRLQLAEIQVVDSAHPDTDLALHAPVTCTDVYPVPGYWEPEYLTDGKTSGDTPPIGFTSLEHHGQDVSASPILVTIDLGSAQTFDRLVLWPRTDTLTADGQTPNFPVDYTVQVADAAAGPFTDATAITGQQAPEPAPLPAALPVFATQFRLPSRRRPGCTSPASASTRRRSTASGSATRSSSRATPPTPGTWTTRPPTSPACCARETTRSGSGSVPASTTR